VNTITKAELERIYNSNTNQKAAEILDISIVTLLKMIDENGIQKKGSGNKYSTNKKIQVVE